MSDNLWYVLKVSSGREDKIKSNLQTELKILEAGKYVLDIIVPSEKIYEVKDGKRKVKQKTFFPGYLFICLSSLTETVRTALRNVPGVLGFLSGRSWGWSVEPIPMRDAEIAIMLGLESGKEATQELLFLVGDSVKITDGPFKGLIGVVKEIFKEKKRLNVTVNIFDRPAPVELSYIQVERCK
jgi:transcriptional antiterminator NusG